jgi:DNA-binding Lrp family transcriptional regulator
MAYEMSGITAASDPQTGRSSAALDEVGERILAELRSDGRISMSALADRMGLSRATVYARVAALEQAGAITGFSAVVDPRRTGLTICSLVFVSVRPQTWPTFRARLAAMPQVEYCAVTTGEHDAMLLIRAAAVADIHDFVIGVISALPEVKGVETVLVLDEVVRRPYLLPTEAASGPRTGQVGMTRFIPAAETHAGLDH